MMDLDQLFSDEIGAMSLGTDDVTVRRLVNNALRGYADLLTDPEHLAATDADLDAFAAAEAAYHAGIEAESVGDHEAAAKLFRVAAPYSLGDANLRLARCLVLAGHYTEALDRCIEAEAEGFDEAADLAGRCYAALEKTPPSRARTNGVQSTSAVRKFEPDSEPGSGPRLESSDDVDPGLTRRLKALACTAPLHDLDNRKAMLEWLEPSAYQMSEIALRIIDLVTIAMDFDTGAGHAEVISRALPFVASQAPHRPMAEHERVARWVLERLINVGTVDRSFHQIYGEVDLEGRYQRQPFYFKIVKEVPGPRGSIVLRASNEAITVLIGALETDVESAQIAAEVKLENLIRRGKLADARSAAEQARYRTVEYGEILRIRLDATRRDLRLVDWVDELPDMLHSALGHIESRLEAEQAIHASITEARDTTEEPVRKRHAAELVEVVEDCIRRHLQLQVRLQGARSVFREEQDRQQFSGRPQREAINLHGQLLEPLLQQPVNRAAGPLGSFFRSAVGATAPKITSIAGLVSTLLQPVAQPLRTAGPIAHPSLTDLPDDSRFTDEHRRRAAIMLNLPGEVRLLSDLVAAAAEYDDDLPALVALHAGHALAPSIDTARGKGRGRLLVAVPTLSTFTTVAASGDDLLVTMADLIDPDDQSSRPFRPSLEEPA